MNFLKHKKKFFFSVGSFSFYYGVGEASYVVSDCGHFLLFVPFTCLLRFVLHMCVKQSCDFFTTLVSLYLRAWTEYTTHTTTLLEISFSFSCSLLYLLYLYYYYYSRSYCDIYVQNIILFVYQSRTLRF